MTTPANLRGWGQGWPVNRSKDMRTVKAARSGVPFTVHHEIAPIIKYLVDEVERRGYMIHTPGQTPDDWSYNNRPIRGRRTPSNHSWGLAIDIDATQYPLGSSKRHPSWMVELFRAHGFDYGGDWTGRKDPMHYEFAGWPSDARRIAASIAGQPAPTPPPYRQPSTSTPPPYNPPGPAPFTPPSPGVPMRFFITDPAYGIRLVITDGTCVMDYGVTKLEQLAATDTRVGGPMTPAAFAAFCAKYPGGRIAMGHLPS